MTVPQVIRVEVWTCQNGHATSFNKWVQTAHQLGISSVTGCQVSRLFFVYGTFTESEIQQLSHELLADPVTEKIVISPSDQVLVPLSVDHTIEVTLLPGVTDPVAENLVRAAHLLGITGVQRAATGQRYWLQGAVTPVELHKLACAVFSNNVIQRFAIDRPIASPFAQYGAADGTIERIALCEADAVQLQAISTDRCLSLNLAEMEAIQVYYQQEGRDPTDVELEMLAQTWSEHCVHKTFKARIDYTGPLPDEPAVSPPVPQRIEGLLKTYIRGATERVKKPWIRSAFVDNAGIMAFDDHWDVAFKVETHNHPSALEPFGGANTGVGGVVRDILGVSARPIANTDVLCFGPQELPESDLPAGTLHPRQIAEGVISGVEDYGNKMGIPTVNGAILYHPGYTANPLVFCGCLGILPRDSHPTQPQPGDLIVVIGGRTGRDGLRGATFSSMEMDQSTGEVSGGSVQIGHPINEKQVLEVVLRARDEGLYSAITDCGAGGLSSAVGEMTAGIGAQVQLERVRLKYPGLRPWEIWLSEAQERMVLAVPPDKWLRMQQVCALHDVEAVCLGELESTGRFRLLYEDCVVADLSNEFLHDGIPRRHLTAVWQPVARSSEFNVAAPADLSGVLLELLAHPNICSKESVVRRYDHEVQGATTVKPLVGVGEHGPGDAAVLLPQDVQQLAPDAAAIPRGLALAVGIAPAYGQVDPYVMGWAAIDEALRNVVAVGADPDYVALLDNFCWGNPNLPDRLGSLVRCAQGCYAAAVAYGAPFISGKDSLNNEYFDQHGQRHTIPGTVLISALALVPDVRQTVTMDLKQAGNRLYLVGDTRDELTGSYYALVRQAQGGTVPQPVPEALERMRALHRVMQAGLVQACHDCSEGGIGVAVAEMCIAGQLGAVLDLSAVPGAGNIARDDALLFSESLSRFVVEVRPADIAAFESQLAGMPCASVGEVTARTDGLQIQGRQAPVAVTATLADLEQAWRGASDVGVLPELFPVPSTHYAAVQLQRCPRVLILHSNGTNRDLEAALASELAGAQPEIVLINQLLSHEKSLLDYHMLVLPGGFSYGDDLGGGTLSALDLRHRIGVDMARFIADGRPVLGICNGFQTLVKSGLLPGLLFDDDEVVTRHVTLAPNASGTFECRWVYLQPQPHTVSLFMEGLEELIYCPVAHAEGRITLRDDATFDILAERGLIALTYVNADGTPAHYPANPNGSVQGIAGLGNAQGNVLGLMPHPENHLFPWQHPRWHRGETGLSGLRLFENGVKRA